MAQHQQLPSADALCTVCAEFVADTLSTNFDPRKNNRELQSSQRWSDSGTSSHWVFHHYDTLEEVTASASSGCTLCGLISDDFGTEPNGPSHLSLYPFCAYKPSRFLATFEKYKSVFWYWGVWEPHVFHIVQHRPYNSQDPIPGVPTNPRAPEVSEIFDRAMPAMPDDQDAIDTARHWLSDCTRNHPRCSRQPQTTLPTRVVDVGQPPHYSEAPKLHISSQGQIGQYLALSHCWGGAIDCKLTQSRLSDYMNALPLGELPKNFQDAIRITRELGLQYMWIDALCIIQDLNADWRAEASKMATYYRQATATISALDAKRSTEGFLGKRQRTHVRISPHFSICQEPRMAADVLENCSLDTRGWCLQERLLSRALLHFGRDKMMWECQEGISSEQSGIVQVTPNNKGWIIDSSKADFINLRRDYNNGTIAPGLSAWYSVVEEFSCRNLTFDSDIFPALAGAAEWFQASVDGGSQTTGAYVAGLWTGDLRRGLLWGARSKQRRNARTIAVPECAPLSRPAQSRLPSWSWASVKGAINFPLKNIGDDDRVQYWDDFQILEVKLSQGYDDFMATDVRGELRIRAPLARVWYTPGIGVTENNLGEISFEMGKKAPTLSSTILVSLDSDRQTERECWVLATNGPPKPPSLIILEKVDTNVFRRAIWIHVYAVKKLR